MENDSSTSIKTDNPKTPPSRDNSRAEVMTSEDKQPADVTSDTMMTSRDNVHADVTSDTTITATRTDKQRTITPDNKNVEKERLLALDDSDGDKSSDDGASDISCVLCLENMRSRRQLERHLTEVHSVKQETMNRFMSLLVQSSDKNLKQSSETSTASKSENEGRICKSSTIEESSKLPLGEADPTVTNLSDAGNEAGEIPLKNLKPNLVEDQILNGLVRRADTAEVVVADTSIENSQKKADSNSYNTNNNNNNLAAASSLALLGASGLQGLNQCRQFNSIFSQSEFGGIKSPGSLLSSQLPSPEKVSPQLRSLKTELCQKVDYNFNTWSEETVKKSPPSADDVQAYEAYVAVRTPVEAVKSYEAYEYRCDRCQLGYPKAAFLQLHKKSAEHRRNKRASGDRKSPSKRQKTSSTSQQDLEKQDDGLLPFKCEVCVESFSEARDILAHYGTTPHMLKLQQHQDSRKHTSASHLNVSETIPAAKLQSKGDITSIVSDFSHYGSLIGATAAQAGLIAMGQQQPLGDVPVLINDRPYRCDLCKVCYSLKQQLMTHLKSVQHQTRSAKLLSAPHAYSAGTASGNVGKQNPLMTGMDSEQTNYINNWLRAQNQLLTQAQNTGSGGPFSPSFLPMLGASGMFPGCGLPSVPPTQQTKLNKTNNGTALQDSAPVTKRSNQHNVIASGKATNKREENSAIMPEAAIKSVISEPTSSVMSTRKNDSYGKLSHTSLVKFLENIGFECVMQFNENRQKVKRVITSDSANQLESTLDSSSENDKPKLVCENNNTKRENIIDIEIKVEKPNMAADLPELQKSTCGTCQKEFSSVWVLKAHQEEVHKDVVSHEDVAAFAVDLRESYERKHKKSSKKVAPVKIEQECTSRTRLPDAKTDQYPSQKILTPVEENAMPQYPQMTPSQAAQMMQYPLLLSMSMMSPMLSMMMPPQDFYNHQPQHAPYSAIDPTVAMRMLHQSQQQQQSIIPSPKINAAAAVQSAATNQKAARTRINEQQLAILREHFDIHNSPGDVQIREMSERTTLPAKVIKHWFRNTLFKERQRNKDSPYNFNVPLSTTLALSESDGNGIVKTMSVDAKVQLNSATNVPIMTAESSSSVKCDKMSTTFKNEPKMNSDIPVSVSISQLSFLNTESKPASVSSSWSPGDLLANGNLPSFFTNPMLNNFSSGTTLIVPQTISTYSSWPAPMAATASSSSTFSISDVNSRIKLPRFNDAQVNEMQALFSKNSYPSDEELVTLAERLNLNLRSVATWFQNARKKLRRAVEKTVPYQEKCGTLSNIDFSPDSNNGITTNFSKDADLSVKGNGDYDNDTDYGELHIVEDDKLDDNNFNEAKYLRNLANQSNSISSADGESSELNTSAFSVPDGGDDNIADGRRMRTNIRPDQQQYLYERFRENTFPSCTELDDIAKAVDLNKPVVQIWFQNTRARERKKDQMSQGPHRRFKKRLCPICKESFCDKKALKSHIALKHVNQFSPGNEPKIGKNVLVDDSRDEFSRLPSTTNFVGNWLNSTTSSSATIPGYLPSLDSLSMTANRSNLNNEAIRLSCLQYEESLKKYMEEYSRMTSGALQSRLPFESRALPELARTASVKGPRVLNSSSTTSGDTRLDDSPLDLSMPSRKSGVSEMSNKMNSSGAKQQQQQYIDDSHSEFYSDNEDGNIGYDQCDAGSTFSQSSRNLYGPGSKRYRTQMSDIQIQVMRTIFTDSKMPTITECETLGHELGLPRRVVQVWFQNARAKEKKAVDGTKKSGDGSSQYGGTSVGQLSNLATEDRCSLCCTKYTAQDTQQDHLYSRGHVSKVKALLQHQERHSVPQAGGADNESVVSLSQHSLSDSRNPQHSSNGGHSTPVKRRSRSQKMRDRKDVNTDAASPSTATSAAAALSAATHLLGSSGHIPVDLMLGMMPMYQGMGGFYPGARLPMMQQNVLPGLMYDPASYGIQLSMLQIPAKAIRKVEERIKDASCSITHYTQDCLSFSDLKKLVSADDWSVACKAHVDVGYICRRCSVVWPRREDCVTHQKAHCYSGVRLKDISSILKLEQQQFECRACQVRHSTVEDYRRHCETRRHQDARKDWIRMRPGTGSSSSARDGAKRDLVIGEIITIDGNHDHIGNAGRLEKMESYSGGRKTATVSSNDDRVANAAAESDRTFYNEDRTAPISPDTVSAAVAGAVAGAIAGSKTLSTSADRVRSDSTLCVNKRTIDTLSPVTVTGHINNESAIQP